MKSKRQSVNRERKNQKRKSVKQEQNGNTWADSTVAALPRTTNRGPMETPVRSQQSSVSLSVSDGCIFISAFWALASYISLRLARLKKPHCRKGGMMDRSLINRLFFFSGCAAAQLGFKKPDNKSKAINKYCNCKYYTVPYSTIQYIIQYVVPLQIQYIPLLVSPSRAN